MQPTDPDPPHSNQSLGDFAVKIARGADACNLEFPEELIHHA